MKSKVVITGGSGLLGTALRQTFADCRVIAPPRDELDVAERDQVERLIAREQPDLIIHCAAMTAVDDCERQPEQAYRVNAQGTQNVAESAAGNNIRLVAVSTDYVFSGDAGRPYSEDDVAAPRSVYGASKLAGERACALVCRDHAIVRVSWLFGPGRVCFIDKLVDLGSREDENTPVRVAHDQKSVPTSSRSAARAIRALAQSTERGVFHVTSPEGCSRYQLARAVFEVLGLPRRLEPCAMADFAAAASRPGDSRLDNRRLCESNLATMPHWRDEMEAYLVDTYGR